LQKIRAEDYEWYQLDGRGHHLVKFTVPAELQNRTPDDLDFACSLPTWTPTHGSVENWDAVELDEDSLVGLLVPRAWWNILFIWLPKKFKIRQFYIKN